MHKKQTSYSSVFSIGFLMFILAICSNSFGQGAGGELKWLRIGEYQSLYSEQLSEVEGSGINRTDIAMSWPAQYGIKQSTGRSKTMWLGCKNFYDTKLGKELSYKVVGVGPRPDADRQNQIFTTDFKLVGKKDHPNVIVDNQLASVLNIYDELDEVDESLIADRMLYIKGHTSLGVTVTKRIYAFGQQNHDNYLVVDYVLKNTGIVDDEGTVYEQTLEDFYLFLQYRYALSGEAVLEFGQGWGSWSSTWGLNTVNHHIGDDPTAADFEMRAHYAWYGPDAARTLSYDEDWGCPNELDDGVMSAAKYTGGVVLHADKSVSDKSDDPWQPRTYGYINSDIPIQQGPMSQYNELYMADRYAAMSAGHPEKTHAEEVGDDYATNFTQSGGGESQSQGFGPYTLAPGDSIHIVIAEGAAGIDRAKNREVGGNWLQWFHGTGQPELTMPDGSATSDHNAYKRDWIQTGIDSLLNQFRNAQANYNAGFNIPQPPPPPEEFIVQSGGDRISLSWADNAASHPNFDGYVIYRSEGNVLNAKSVYQKIWECDGPGAVHEFDDLTAVRGFDYYYYIQSKDDGSTNDVEPGKPLTSSLFWTITSVPANLQRPAGTDLEEVRVVPNPYDIRSRAYQFGDEFQYDRLAFYGLPPECSVKIFTERGDLIWEKEHTDGSGDELWDSLTSSGQIVVSGIYILYVETPDGDSIYRKFVIIR